MKKFPLKRLYQIKKTHNFSENLSATDPKYAKQVFKYTFQTLKEDLKPLGDLTTKLLNLSDRKIRAEIIAKSDGILAGIQEVDFFLNGLNHKTSAQSFMVFRFLKKDGSFVHKGDRIVFIEGLIQNILAAERTMLNLLQRMSGIATLTHQYAQKVPSSVLITPTRKTLWGLLDKRACTVGGGGTHRLNLSDAILLKDTHLEIFGLTKIFEEIKRKFEDPKKFGRFLEIEVETYQQALKVGEFFNRFQQKFSKRTVSLILMFDNMKPALIKKIIDLSRKDGWYEKVFFEASGGITLKNVQIYAKTGVDIISVGALTHSAPALDFSLKIVS